MNIAKWVVSGTFLGCATGLGLLYWGQRSLLYPSNIPEGSRAHVDTPDAWKMPFEEVRLKTPDGETIHAYAITQRRSSESPTILYCHANAGNMGHRLPIALKFYERGHNFVMFSYRGYGRSTGKPSEKGLNIDAQTVLDYILQHPNLSNTKIVVYGPSLGGAVGVSLVSKNQSKIHALLLENTFTSVPDMVPNVLPVPKYIAPFLTSMCRDIWPTEVVIQRIPEIPILFLAGSQDTLVKPPQMKRVYECCRAPKKWVEFPMGDHNTTVVQPGYFDAIFAFLKDNKIMINGSKL